MRRAFFGAASNRNYFAEPPLISSSIFTLLKPFCVLASPSARSLPTSAAAAMPGSDSPNLEWPAKQVRDTFFKFFEDKRHVFWRSSPVVPFNDPTLLFANAGMNQYKSIFLGTVDPNTALSKLSRAYNTQKCIRAGGKHNDLDDVGKDTYHHTFFEMLGNWSFGDYFKEEAISWAWELLTKVYKLPSDRIYATYFGGDEAAGLAPDNEARDIWLKFLPPGRVLPFGCKDNFWEMGDTGPCGPCTEVHFDRIGNREASSLVNNDDPTLIEIWNLVFIQFNREADKSLKPLPAKHVDTGMGFERLTSILQNKMSNYDTDVFLPIFDAIQLFLNLVLVPDVLFVTVKTLSFAIADGSRPGNDGREYVLRRILRRAVRYGREVLKAKEGFFNRLVSVVVKVMGDVFPELKQQEVHIRNVIKEEEESFGRTLIKGIEKFKNAVQHVHNGQLSGELMAEEQGLTVDEDGYNRALEAARERSRSAQSTQAGGAIVMDADATSALHRRGIAPTDDSFKYVWFKDHESVVKAIYTGSEFVESVETDDDIGVVLESTSFYAEQGGQIFDTGSLEGPHASFKVHNVQVFGGFVLHIGSYGTGISVGDKVVCKVDYGRRSLIAPNHTCTHMLNFALREVLGDHVDQKGSIVLPEKLRFDFSHGKPVDPDNLRKIESIVYPDPVRVVSVGEKVEDLLADPENKKWLSISSELCGGTHISNTREAKAFALLSEEGIAKGIRRITAVTTDRASDAMRAADEFEQHVDNAAKLEGSSLEEKVLYLKSNVETLSIPAAKKAEIKNKIVQLQDRVRKAQKQIAEENKRKAVMITAEKAELAASSGKTFCVSQVEVGLDVNAVREAVTKVMEQKGISVMVFSTDKSTNKAVVCAGVPEKGDKGKLDVTEWLTNALEPLKGRCGKGKGGLATGQGTDASHVSEAMDLAASFASLKLT
ncbi:hypothetical protein PIB30_034918 [Stylosanthes scabra]|uniref:Alanine--tRNA ligase n=1 Tax=Stylosanthes scabra TaxID=79078 RepID=A0ABU6UCB8_9FABA|nr:hypothetical protein [Stylosanthes scabra]